MRHCDNPNWTCPPALKRMHPNLEGTSSSRWCQQLANNLAARSKSDGNGGRRLQQGRAGGRAAEHLSVSVFDEVVASVWPPCHPSRSPPSDLGWFLSSLGRRVCRRACLLSCLPACCLLRVGGRVVFIPFLSGDYFASTESSFFKQADLKLCCPSALAHRYQRVPAWPPRTGRPTSKNIDAFFSVCPLHFLWDLAECVEYCWWSVLGPGISIPLLHYPACCCRCVHRVFYSPGAGCSSAAHHLSSIWTRDLTTLTVT